MTRAGWIATGSVALVLLGCSSAPDAPGVTKTAVPKPVRTVAPQGQPDYVPVPANFPLKVIVLSQECFDTAGCNVTFRVDPSYTGAPLSSDRTFQIIYTVSGSTDGAMTGNFTATGAGGDKVTLGGLTESLATVPHAKSVLTATARQVIAD